MSRFPAVRRSSQAAAAGSAAMGPAAAPRSEPAVQGVPASSAPKRMAVGRVATQDAIAG